ncbi:hypothetical protein Leryth_007097 [Lithospermum erythrorhizon]|nr:hypothetical protein Leryth_007097 [Lithospermum erythrorhizon]
MYLLLPLDTAENSTNGSCKVNWTAVESCFSTVNFFKENAWLNAKQSERSRVDSLTSRSVKDDYMNTKVVHLANSSIHIDDLKGMVVMGIHTGRIYSVFDAIDNSSGESPFHGNSDSVPSRYSSFADYFKKKYGIGLLLTNQPLLLLKQTHNAFNLLVDFKKEGVSTIKRSKGDPKSTDGNQQNHVHMPPELLIKVDVRRDVLKSFYLLPSLMHRMESLMLASQLRKQISCQSTDLHIPISLILEALTTLRCNESFSMERLELLGDSILKYTVSCHLFLKYPKFHEGQLSSRRSSAVRNSTLHKLGTDRKLQGYIRDGAFEPRRWKAPGQRSIRASPCDHGVDTREVPLDIKKITEDPKIVSGKCCDRGHRWMGSKTISDCLEALIGAYYVGGGLIAALQLMKWFSIDAEVEPFLVEEAIKRASLHSWTPKSKDIETLESKIGYRFTVRGLLLEAITHATTNEKDGGYCYQRLEFLGDAVLDILITWHLYQNHLDVDPGELTDLRSASVNNENFALAAVKHDLHPHLQHCSGELESQIHTFVQAVSDSGGNKNLLQGAQSPKVLGDLVESIVGAILIDTKLNLDEIWKIVEPILSPIVTPDMLELPPLRELIELCDSLGYFVKDDCTTDGEMVRAELKLQLKDALLVSEGIGQTKKTAKGQAALHVLKQLETKGISSSKKRKLEMDPSSSLCEEAQINSKTNHDISGSRKKQKLSKLHKDQIKSNSTDATPKASDSENLDIPEIPPINMKKGGPRTAMYDLCKIVQWPMPSFQTAEEKSRTPIEFDDGYEKKTGFSSFVSIVTLTIPEVGPIECSGDKRADKKSSYDSAALNMLHELEQQGKIRIKS